MKILRIKSVLLIFAAVFLVAGFVMPNMASATVPGVNELVSVDSSENQTNQVSRSNGGSTSGDGRFIVFDSEASNLVSGDTNGKVDVFIRDRTNGTTQRVSVSSSGTESNSDSSDPRISYDGRFVVFASSASNLVVSDSNGAQDVFIHDMQTGATSLISKTSSGTIGNNSSVSPDVSADGRFVVFASNASNLVSGINPIGVGQQIFFKDMSSGALKALSVNSSGNQGNYASSTPRISCDGGVVTFSSASSNLVSSDTNGKNDIFIDVLGWSSDMLMNATLLSSVDSDIPDVSCNGNYVAYHAGDDVFAYNRLTQGNTQVSLTDTDNDATGEWPSISDDGRYVAFQSDSSALANGYTRVGQVHIYVRDTKEGTTQLVSLTADGRAGGFCQAPSISDDGSYVAYQSAVEELGSDHNRALVVGDVNHYADVFISKTGF